MEQATKKYGKEMISYNDVSNDYVGDNELTVTITLNEYRSLVKGIATKEADISKVRSELYKKDQEIQVLKEKLEATLFNKANVQED